jgi:hypothetical protein
MIKNKNMFIAIAIVLIILVSLNQDPTKKTAGETPQLSQLVSDSIEPMYSGHRIQQSFIPPHDFTITHIRLKVQKQGSPGHIWSVVRDSEKDIFEGGVSLNSFPDDEENIIEYTVAPSGNGTLDLVAGQLYNLLLFQDGADGITSQSFVHYSVSDVYSGGTMKIEFSPVQGDIYFELIGIPSTPPVCTPTCNYAHVCTEVAGPDGCGGSCTRDTDGLACPEGACSGGACFPTQQPPQVCPINFNDFISYANSWVGCTAGTCT